MKRKYIYTVIAASCAMFASCSQEGDFASQTVTPQGKAITEISASSGVESRAVVSSTDNTKINWESEDALKVFGLNESSEAANADYTLSSDEGSTSGKFTNSESTVSTIQACMYPNQSTATWSDSKLTCNIPTVQTATAGSFDKNAAIMYYIGDKTAVTLNSAVAFLKVKVTESNVHAITISSTSTALSGDVEITSSGVAAASIGTVNSVTLVAPAADGKTYDNCLETGKDYYIAVLPGTIENPSISYTYINSDSHTATVKTKEGSSSITFATGTNVKPIGVNFSTGTVTTKTAVQLWENGPYFALFNVGSTITSYASATDYTTDNVGGLYTWGGTNNFNVSSPFPEDDHYTGTESTLPSNYDTAARLWSSAWCMPEKAALDNLVAGVSISSGTGTGTYTKWTWLDGTEGKQYVSGCTIKGYKIEGIASGYTSNSVFFPAAGYYYKSSEVSQQGDYGIYWSSMPYGSGNAYKLNALSGNDVQVNNYGYRGDNGFSVRAVLK